MAEPGSSLREQAEKLLLAAVGAAALTTERIDELGDALAQKAGIKREEATALVREVADGWRREAGRIGERANDAGRRVVRELGLVTKDEVEDLELRVAQLEHRLRLVEQRPE